MSLRRRPGWDLARERLGRPHAGLMREVYGLVCFVDTACGVIVWTVRDGAWRLPHVGIGRAATTDAACDAAVAFAKANAP